MQKVAANDMQSAKKKNTKLKPNEVGSIWRRRSDGMSERWLLQKVAANDMQSAKKKNPKLKPNEVGSIWKGGATK